jgi:NADPH:quinone reductase-like Zn-dependent oxidoreductase
MKAFAARAYGGPEVMALLDMPEPTPGRGEVVVAVRGSSVNPVDWKVRDGTMRLVTGSRYPKVYGCDLAGVVHSRGRMKERERGCV